MPSVESWRRCEWKGTAQEFGSIAQRTIKTQHNMRVFESLRPSLRLALSTPKHNALGQTRWLHKSKPAPVIPKPRPFVPDVQTFLTLIGRNLHKQASKFPSWDAMFSLGSMELRELGIEPPRNRRYLLRWLQRYRDGALGPGGDFKYVKDGEALLKVAAPPAGVISNAKWVVNVPHGEDGGAKSAPSLVRPKGYGVEGLRTITGPYATALPGNAGAVVKVTEGMWEHKRGRKIDGGERRRDEIRFKKRSAERRAEREAELLELL
ncbi:IGR protein motif-domain-containing protein [Stachybotrys elegans]|uniref:Small ribosomal subunit protein mS41 n=1 Tax=Stachybotrys elegans TaxID=80388 RepID=A0A8K0WQV1_9HYPO|nr:IGR protein motif-domain-containing protein [Stachybotrys elegans]